MKLKELKRTVNVCWSPAEHYPVILAAGSAAQQVDASFSSSSSLDLYSLNLEDPGVDLELKASLPTQHKFHKLVWSGAGLLVGGCDGGLLQFYNAEKLMNNAPDCLLGSSTKHNGHVSALDINPYQKNLLASGASESEIFIWDLNNTSQPMTPGNKSQPPDHVQDLAWNQQVQHILGSTFANRCVVWDLRKNEPIMKLSDSQSRTRWRSLAWHPSVATQVCIASEDDQVPVVQLWDLRLAASPLVTLESHQKGVMALSWCRQDPDLLLTAGKDGRVLCWNPNNTQAGGSLLCEVSQQQQWVFDVSWCPRDAALFAASSFDHQLTVYSILAGSKPETNSHQQSNIMDSFGGADSFSQLPVVSRVPTATHQPQLPTAPKWLKRPTRAKFGFGGKLVTFEKCPQEAGPQRQVYVSQVVSEPELVEKSAELDAILNSTLSNDPDASERLAEYCRLRGDQAADQQDRYTWFFLRANFLSDFRTEALNLLGFKQDEIPAKFKSSNVGDASQLQSDLAGLSRGESTETEAELSTDTSTDLSEAQTLIERKLANLDIEPNVTKVVIPNGEDSTSMICRALVCGNFEEAVELCLDAKKITDALIIASLGSPELVSKVQRWYLSRNICDPVSLVTNALACGKWSTLIGSAANSWRHVLAALITHSSDEERSQLAEMLGDQLSKEADPALSEAATICYLVAMSPEHLVQRWNRTRNGDVDSLTTLTTLALLARRAALNRGRHIQAGGPLESVVCEYAGRLAAQGCLHSALTALQGMTHAPLTDRLQGALLTQQRQQQHQQQPVQQQSYNRPTPARSSHARPNVPDPYAPPAPGYEQPWPSSSVPAQNQYNRFQQPSQPPLQPPLPPLQPTPLQQMAPTPQAPPTQPPRPGSVGPSGGLTSRSKYKVDPSVQSAPMYNQYGYNNPITSQPQSYGYNSPLPDQYNNSSVSNNTFAPINPSYSSNPGLNPVNPVNPAMNPANPVLNPANPALNPMNPVLNGNYYNQETPQSKPIPPGWNDPPLPSKTVAKPKQEVQSQAPITHPLFGVEPQHVPLNPAGPQYAGQQYVGQQYAGQQYAGQQYPGQYDQYQNNMMPQQQHQVETAAIAKPPTPAPKPPLPEQYISMQTVFDGIRAECYERAHHPQMKRKLEDVHRRLETLYDMLREYKLTDSAIQSLQMCVQYCQAHDYGTALQSLTALATGADFAAAASFLPGLKVLVQLAHQLQVYI